MSILSDDNVRDGSERYRPAFTGSFIGMCCQDLKTNNIHADFDWFEYKEIKKKEKIEANIPTNINLNKLYKIRKS